MNSDPFAKTEENSVKHQLLQGASREDAVVEALQECQAAIDAGKSIDREAILAKYPMIRDELSACLEGLELMQPAKNMAATTPSRNTSPAPGQLAPSATLGDFRIERELGRGGMGVVYEAEQLSVGRKVALKVLPYAAMLDKRQVARFQNEARAAATLEHPNIVPVYFVGNERGVYYYAMRLIDGKNLAEVLEELRGNDIGDSPLSQISSQLLEENRKSRPGISDAQDAKAETVRDQLGDRSTSLASDHSTRGRVYFESIARLAKQAAEALDFAHSHGIIHRDIKPANIMLDDLGDAWITDFGLARIEADAGMTMTGDLVGTLRYMSPEQTLAKRMTIDHRSDIYSLGATLYELLTLGPLFEASDRATLLKRIAFEDPTLPSKIVATIPRDLETIVGKALEKNPDDRYRTAGEFAGDLQAFLEHRTIVARPPSALDRTFKWVKRNPALVTMTGVASFLIGVVSVIALLFVLNGQSALRESLREQRIASNLAKQAVDDMYVDFAESWLRQQSGLTREQERFLGKAADYYEQIASLEHNSHSDDLILTLMRLSRARRALGDKAAAELAADRAVTVANTRFNVAPGSLNSRNSLASAILTRIDAHWGDDDALPNVKTDCERCIEVCEETIHQFPDNLQASVFCAEARALLSVTHIHAGWPNYEQADLQTDAAFRSMQEVLTAAPQNVEYKRAMIRVIRHCQYISHVYLGAGMFGAVRPGKQERVRELAETRIAIARDLLATSPGDPDLRVALALSLLEHSDAGIPERREAVEILEDLVKQFPNRDEFRRQASLVYEHLAAALREKNQYKESNQWFEKAIAARDGPQQSRPRAYLAYAHMGMNFRQLELFSEMATSFEQAVDMCRRNGILGQQWNDAPDLLLLLIDFYKSNELPLEVKRCRSHFREILDQYPKEFLREHPSDKRPLLHFIVKRFVESPVAKYGEKELSEAGFEMLRSIEIGEEIEFEAEKHLAIGKSLDILGRRHEAITYLRESTSIPGNSNTPEIEFQLAKLLLQELPASFDQTLHLEINDSLGAATKSEDRLELLKMNCDLANWIVPHENDSLAEIVERIRQLFVELADDEEQIVSAILPCLALNERLSRVDFKRQSSLSEFTDTITEHTSRALSIVREQVQEEPTKQSRWDAWHHILAAHYRPLNWEGAEREGRLAVRLVPDKPNLYMSAAILLLLSGYDDEYSALCDHLIANRQDWTGVDLARAAALAIIDPKPPRDPAALLQLTQSCVDEGPSWSHSNHLVALGRTGEWQELLTQLNPGTPVNMLLLSIASSHSEKADDARQYFNQAIREMEDWAPSRNVRMRAEAFLAEAASLLEMLPESISPSN